MVGVDVSLPSGVAVLDGVAPTWGNTNKVYLVVGTPVELQQVEKLQGVSKWPDVVVASEKGFWRLRGYAVRKRS